MPDPDTTPWQTTTWQAPRAPVPASVPPGGPPVPMPRALWRGLRGRCPGCGIAPIFTGYLRVLDHPCAVCATPLQAVRADDAPPYFTILIAAHLIIPLLLWSEAVFAPRVWVEIAIWVPLTFVAVVGLLRPVKGVTVALMLKLNMLAEDAA